MNTPTELAPGKVRSDDGLGLVPPLPRKKPAVFHHPMGFELYDGLSMDLHAMTYAEPLLAEVELLRASLKDVLNHWREFGPDHGFDECVERAAGRRGLGA